MTTNVTNLQHRSTGKVKSYLLMALCIAVPLAVGFVSSGITRNQMQAFGELNQPPFSPPAWLFPIAWTILYVLMGIASYLMIRSDSKYKVAAICLYISQLIMNFMWSPVFFNMQDYWVALGILATMWLTTIILAITCWFVDKRATWCLVPYILWMTFATYLNAGVGVLNA